MTNDEIDALVKRLRAKRLDRTSFGGVRAGAYHEMAVNPDGPKAANLIETLRRERDELVAALRPFAAKADKRERYTRENQRGWVEPDSAQITHRLGDFRKAREAIGGAP